MLLIDNQKVSTKDFIKAFNLYDVLGLNKEEVEKPEYSFRITKPLSFEFIPDILADDRLGYNLYNGKKTAAGRFIPREYRTVDCEGDSVEVRYTSMLPRPNQKTGVMEYPVERKKNWKFEKTLFAGEEDLFLFMLASPECNTAPTYNKDLAYYRLRNKQKEIKESMLREEKLDEAHQYIKSLTGQALVIKALGARVEDAYAIYDNEGEPALRLALRTLAGKNPFQFMELMTKDGGEVSGRIKYAVGKSMIVKVPTGVPNLEVWQFADGQEICKTQGGNDAYTSLQDTLVYSQDLYQKLCRMIDKDISPEALAMLRNKSADTAEKINALADAEMLTFDPKLKTVNWVVKGEIVEEPILNYKKSWKAELTELFDKDKSLGDILNDKYKQAKKVLA